MSVLVDGQSLLVDGGAASAEPVMMEVTVQMRGEVVATAGVDVTARRVVNLAMDDDRRRDVFVGLAVLDLCVEKILQSEFELQKVEGKK